jgi:hypothetical protein
MSLVSKYERYFRRAAVRTTPVRTNARRQSDLRQQAHRRGLRTMQRDNVIFVFKPRRAVRRGSK